MLGKRWDMGLHRAGDDSSRSTLYVMCANKKWTLTKCKYCKVLATMYVRMAMSFVRQCWTNPIALPTAKENFGDRKN